MLELPTFMDAQTLRESVTGAIQLVKYRCFRVFQWAERMNGRSEIRQARERFARMFGAPRTKKSRPIRISSIGDLPQLP
jgi:hypothetical protein